MGGNEKGQKRRGGDGRELEECGREGGWGSGARKAATESGALNLKLPRGKQLFGNWKMD